MGGSLIVIHGRIFGSKTSPHDEEARAAFDLLVALFAQGQARGELDPALDPALYTAHYVAVATSWVLQWPTATDEPITDRLVAALHILLWGAARSRTGTANS